MIQERGKIRVANAKQSEAVQRALFVKGYTWASSGNNASYLTKPFLYWDNSFMAYDDEACVEDFEYNENPLHTLSDFGIEEVSNERPIHAPKFEFGDKVVSDNGNKWWVVGTNGTLTFIVGSEKVFQSIEKGIEHDGSEDVHVVLSNRLTLCPKPEKTKFSLLNGGEITITFSEDGPFIGRRKFSTNDAVTLAELILKKYGE